MDTWDDWALDEMFNLKSSSFPTKLISSEKTESLLLLLFWNFIYDSIKDDSTSAVLLETADWNSKFSQSTEVSAAAASAIYQMKWSCMKFRNRNKWGPKEREEKSPSLTPRPSASACIIATATEELSVIVVTTEWVEIDRFDS